MCVRACIGDACTLIVLRSKVYEIKDTVVSRWKSFWKNRMEPCERRAEREGEKHNKLATSNVYKNEICFREQGKSKQDRVGWWGVEGQSSAQHQRQRQRQAGSYKFYYNYHDCAFFPYSILDLHLCLYDTFLHRILSCSALTFPFSEEHLFIRLCSAKSYVVSEHCTYFNAQWLRSTTALLTHSVE